MSGPISQSVANCPSGPVLRVSDLRQWVYCPRVAYFTLVCPVPKRPTWKMVLGQQKEARLARLQRRRSLRRFGLSSGTVEANVPLYAPTLGLAGKLDLLIRQGPLRYPVEVKFTQGPAALNHRIQLVGYALVMEEIYGLAVPHGYVVLLPDDRVETVSIDPPLRELTRHLIRTLREMIRHEQIPPPNPILARCRDCEYQNFCGDVL